MTDYTVYNRSKISFPSDAMLRRIKMNDSLQDHAVKIIATETRFVRVKCLSLFN